MDIENNEEIIKILDEVVSSLADKNIDFKIMNLHRNIGKRLDDLTHTVIQAKSVEVKNKYIELLEKIESLLKEVDIDVTTSK